MVAVSSSIILPLFAWARQYYLDEKKKQLSMVRFREVILTFDERPTDHSVCTAVKPWEVKATDLVLDWYNVMTTPCNQVQATYSPRAAMSLSTTSFSCDWVVVLGSLLCRQYTYRMIAYRQMCSKVYNPAANSFKSWRVQKPEIRWELQSLSGGGSRKKWVILHDICDVFAKSYRIDFAASHEDIPCNSDVTSGSYNTANSQVKLRQ